MSDRIDVIPQSGVPRVSFSELVDLASDRVGGEALWANNEFFAPKERLVQAAPAVFIADKYDDHGKWMDGWETIRRRTPGHDACVVKLGIPGVIHGVNVDTAFFVGNYPEYCSLEAIEADGALPSDALALDGGPWKEIVSKTLLLGGSFNYIPVTSSARWTHLRLKIYPDGGVARLRVHGEARPDWKKLREKSKGGTVDLSAIENGGTVVTCNDNFFGPKDNLILPGRSKTMGGGWETRRKRGPGYDWIVVKLGHSGKVRKLEVDTHLYKGNFPESCSVDGLVLNQSLQACDVRDRTDLKWQEILPRTKLQPSQQHFFEKELKNIATAYQYIRLNIYPDGGISRLRVHGDLAD